MSLTFGGVSEDERDAAEALRAWPPKPGRWFRRLASRRERTIRLVAVVVVLVLALAIAVVAYFASYQPLVPPYFGYSAVRVLAANGRPASSFATPGPASVTEWREPNGAFSVQYVVTIDNNGPYPVLVSRVTSWSPSTTPTAAYRDNFDERGFAGGSSLKPFIVVGHGNQTVALHVEERCVASPTRRIVNVTTLPVTFSFLGFTHRVAVHVAPLVLQLRNSC